MDRGICCAALLLSLSRRIGLNIGLPAVFHKGFKRILRGQDQHAPKVFNPRSNPSPDRFFYIGVFPGFIIVGYVSTIFSGEEQGVDPGISEHCLANPVGLLFYAAGSWAYKSFRVPCFIVCMVLRCSSGLSPAGSKKSREQGNANKATI